LHIFNEVVRPGMLLTRSAARRNRVAPTLSKNLSGYGIVTIARRLSIAQASYLTLHP